MKFNSGCFIADGNAVNVDVGFIPDLLICLEGQEETNAQFHMWARQRADSASLKGKFGFVRAGTGTITEHAAAVNGFAAYDTFATKAMLPAPDGEGEEPSALPAAYTTTLSTAATARSTTALGTILKPSSGNENGYCYECTTAGTSSAEPTWPTVPGESVTDGTVIFICRELKIKNVGAKGFTLGATGSTDSDEWSWFAFAADKVSPELDAAANDLVQLMGLAMCWSHNLIIS